MKTLEMLEGAEEGTLQRFDAAVEAGEGLEVALVGIAGAGVLPVCAALDVNRRGPRLEP